MPHDVFISYSRKDRERVRLVAEELARRGYDVWWDPKLRGGQDFRDAIEEALKSARCVMVAWSRHSLESGFVIDEAERGKQRGILLPVFIDAGIGPPLGFGGIHTNDISGWLADPSRPEQFDQLSGDLAGLLGQPPPAVPPRPATWPRPPADRSLGARRRAMLGAAGLIVALAAGGIVYSMTGSPPPSIPESVRDSTRADSSSAVPVLPGPRTGMLVGLRCALPGESRNPIGERADQVTPPEYRVDAGRHLLMRADGQPVRVVQAASVGTPLQSRRLIVAHHTAAPARAVESYLEDPDRGVSAHLLIHRDGSVTQLVPFDIRAFHAGRSRWNDLENLNLHSIGIEMENLGPLAQRDGAWYFAQTLRVPADSVERLAGPDGRVGGWHGYTDAQLRAFFQVSCALRRAYPTIEDVVGHEEIAQPTGVKVDPGPAFPLDAMRRRLFPARAPA